MNHAEQPIFERVRILRRRFRTQHRLVRGPIEAVPLVNVVLLLVLFFIVNSAFVLEPGVTVNLPTSPFAAGAPYGAMVVTISQEGQVFFNDEKVAMDGLESALSQAVFEHPDAPLVIQADGRVQHSTLVQVYNLAMAAGVKQVVLATRVASRSAALP
ncbi:MAG: biopolymer transporter ExbD [Verrucomicrobiota bacterium]